jgi:hypothetical protein
MAYAKISCMPIHLLSYGSFGTGSRNSRPGRLSLTAPRTKYLIHKEAVPHTYGAPPDFLWILVALANFMRLSLLKAAHAVLDGATYRKSGSGSSSIDPQPFRAGPYSLTGGPPGLDELLGSLEKQAPGLYAPKFIYRAFPRV